MSEVRAKLLRHNNFREKIVTVSVPSETPGEAPEQLKVLIRQPSVGQRSEIMAQMKVGKDLELKTGDGLSRGLALGIVYCALDPESRRPLFQVADIDSLIGSPSGSWFDTLANSVWSLMDEATEEAKK
jgi:hypothetical protein